jgi:hypothetical protein
MNIIHPGLQYYHYISPTHAKYDHQQSSQLTKPSECKLIVSHVDKIIGYHQPPHNLQKYHQHRPAADMSHLISVPPGFFWTYLVVYSKEKFNSNGDKASLCFRPFWIGNTPDKYLPIRTLLYISFQHILISLTSFMGTPNSMRILYNTSLPIESQAF